jgi:hypothetical protein
MAVRRPGYGSIVGTLALFLVLAGSAYGARHYLITSKRQIKPSVLRSLRRVGPAGPAGSTGATGASGGAGSTGPAGATGATGPVAVFAGRVDVATSAPETTFLTVPGIAHVSTLECTSGGSPVANVVLFNDGSASSDVWYEGDSEFTTNWSDVSSAPTATGGATFHIGTGTGSGAQVITVTVNWEDGGSDCIFQGTAEIATAS